MSSVVNNVPKLRDLFDLPERVNPGDFVLKLSEVVDHSLAGLGIVERKKLLSTISNEVVARKDAIEEREQRLRGILGNAYSGLDVDGILSGRVDARDPAVTKGINTLRF